MMWKVFVVRHIEVVGNEIYSSAQIEKWVKKDKYSWNSVYVCLKNKWSRSDEEIPFVDSMKITMKSPGTIRVQVLEKGVLGYIYIPSLGQNAYFDKDGFVVELSGKVLDGVTKVSGLEINDAKLYQKLPLNDSSILRTLLSVTQLLKKYETMPQVLLVQDGKILLSYGKIQVDVGSGSYLNEKILRMVQILPKIDGKTGTLHLETWTENSTDIFFRKKELTEIPKDVQTVPQNKKEKN